MKLYEFFHVNEGQDDWEIRNLHKLDHILVKLADMVVRGQQKESDYFGMVAACVLDPDNNIVARLNIPAKDGRRIHAERAAMVAYYKKYGEIPEGSIILTTLSPCCEHMDDRAGESCTDLINKSPVHKVYCGFIDPSQHGHNDRRFTLQETNNPKIRAICEKLADVFLDDDEMHEAIDRDDAISKIKKLQNTSGRNENELANIERIIKKLMNEFDIKPEDIGQHAPVDPLKAKLAKAAYDKQMAADALRGEWKNIKGRFVNMFAEDTVNEVFTSKQQVIAHFIKIGKTAAQGASAWEKGWRGRVPKKPKEPALQSTRQYRFPYNDENEAFDIGMGQASHRKDGLDEVVDISDLEQAMSDLQSEFNFVSKYPMSQWDLPPEQRLPWKRPPTKRNPYGVEYSEEERKSLLGPHYVPEFDIGTIDDDDDDDYINESINVADFKEILKKFLPLAKKIVKLNKMPTIILRNTISDNHQPTMGRFRNDTYTLELAIANRQPVDILRTLAHELTHAKQNEEHVNIDPTTGSRDENEANAMAGIVIRHFNKEYPEYLSYQPVEEGKTNGRKRIR